MSRRRRAAACASPAARLDTLDTLDAIVRAYRAEYGAHAQDELRFFAAQPSFAEAVRLAGLATGPGAKRFAHQYRIPGHVLREAEQLLQRDRSRLARARTFPALHAAVHEAIGDVRGVGELMVYDTALRLGAFRGLAPDRVYLHRGTRAGARALGLDHRAASLALADLPGPLARLSAAEAEDVLCIYKQQLAALATARQGGSRVRRGLG